MHHIPIIRRIGWNILLLIILQRVRQHAVATLWDLLERLGRVVGALLERYKAGV